MNYGPNKNEKFPNKNLPNVCFIKNVITKPNIQVGDYTYYDDVDGADKFEEHVLYHYEFFWRQADYREILSDCFGNKNYHERSKSQNEQRYDLSFQPDGKRLGKSDAQTGGFAL